MSETDEDFLPVFISSTELNFYNDKRKTVQLLTLYNPYSHSVNYKILCTATRSYVVSDPSGSIASECCKDIVVRYNQHSPPGTEDKLKVTFMKNGESKISGSKVVLLKIFSKYEKKDEDEQSSALAFQKNQLATSYVDHDKEKNQSIFWVLMFIASICALGLICPTAGDIESELSSFPQFMHITLPQKLVSAYILGIITILVLRPL